MVIFRPIAGLVLAVALGSTVAEARGDKGGKHHKHMKMVLEELELSNEQKTRIQELHEAGRAKGEELRKKIKEARKAFEDAVKAPQTSDETLRQLHEAYITLKLETMRLHFDQMLAVRSVLTEAQRKEFAELLHKAKRFKHWKDED